MTLGVAVVAIVIGVPALVFVLWPLLGSWRRGLRRLSAAAARPREQLDERKRAALRALRELEFEHEAGHVSDADYAELRARYEGEAAAILTELDRLEPAHPAEAPPPTPPWRRVRRRGWRHPVALTAGAVPLVVFGGSLGVGIVRYTEPDRCDGRTPPARGRPKTRGRRARPTRRAGR